MEQPQKITNRKKFLLWGAAILSSVTVLKFIPRNSKKSQTQKKTVKMLAQDGTLVEVEIDKISCGTRKKISDEQLKSFVTKNKTSI